MTVCVAALAQFDDDRTKGRSPIVIMAADRMVTVREREYEFRDSTKCYWVTDQVGIMISGDPDALLLVCQQVYRTARDKPLTKVPDIVAEFAACYEAERRQAVENTAFRPFGLTIDDFLKRQNEFSPEFRERLVGAIDNDDADLGSAIIAGIDEDGAHLFTVSGVGAINTWSAGGYVAIGSGAEIAESAFIASQYTPYRDWMEALVLTHNAKRRAEEASGVGRTTDLYYSLPGQRHVYFPPDSELQSHLDQTFEKRLQGERLAVTEDARTLGKFLDDANAKARLAELAETQAEPGVSGVRIEPERVSEGAEEGQPESQAF